MTSPRIDVGMYVPAKPPVTELESAATTAEHVGLDSVFVWDHLVDFFPQALWNDDFTWMRRAGDSPHEWFDFQTLLGYLAGKVTNLRLGVGVTEPLRRHPVVLAQAMLTLSHLSTRPPILGIGSGEPMNTEPYGLDFAHAVGKLDEALQVMRLAFTSQGPISFEGRHYQLRDALLDLPPGPRRAPAIWVAAHGPRMLQLTGRYGDGWYPFAIASPEDYASRLAVIHAAAREAGRDPEAITPAFHAITIVGRTEQEARAMLETEAVRFWGLLFPDAIWQLFGVEHPFGPGFCGYQGAWPLHLDRTTWRTAIAKVPPVMVESMLWGTPDQLVAKLRAFGDAGLRYVVPFFASAAVSKEAADFSVEALRTISRALASEQEEPAVMHQA